MRLPTWRARGAVWDWEAGCGAVVRCGAGERWACGGSMAGRRRRRRRRRRDAEAEAEAEAEPRSQVYRIARGSKGTYGSRLEADLGWDGL